MDTSTLLLAMASFIGGLLVASRMASWVALLVVTFRARARTAATTQRSVAIVPLFLHSGPWALGLAIVAVYYAAGSPYRSYLWAIYGGLGLAIAFVAVAILLALWRRRRPSTPQPLTAERLLAIKRRFFWRNSLIFGVSVPAALALQSWARDHPVILILAFLPSLAGGWVWSWFMWQWYGESLKANEKARQKRAQQNAA